MAWARLGDKHGRGHWLVSGAIVLSAASASALALLPALLLGLVLLLRDSLGPASVPFGLTFSVIAWFAPDWSQRASLLAAFLQGMGSGLALHLLRVTLIATACLAPAVAALIVPGRDRPVAALSCLSGALAVATLGWALSGTLVDILLMPALIMTALRLLPVLVALRPARRVVSSKADDHR